MQAAGAVGHLADQVRQAVESFEPRTHREQVSRRRFLEYLPALPDPFDRSASPVHVTGSAIVSGRRGTVLHLHKRLGLWLQPGGHIDPGELPSQAAVRETEEETGLVGRVAPGAPQPFHLDVHSAGNHVHLDLRYLLLCDEGDPSPGPGESAQVRWFSLEDASRVADPGLVDAIGRLRAWGRSTYPPSSEGLKSQSRDSMPNLGDGAATGA